MPRPSLRLLSIIVVLAVAFASANATLAASLSVSSARVQEAGDAARVCVSLSSGGEDIAATQNDLVWDPNCASFVDKCEANSAHGKQLMPSDIREGQYRVIIISLQDTNTIPDGELYCCTFRVNPSSSGSCCAIGVQQQGGSDPEGNAISLAARGGQVCVASGPGSSAGLEGGTGGQAPVVGADLGTGAPQPAAQQPAAQAGGSNAAGTGNAVASGGTGGVQGGTGGVPGGVGGVPGGVGGVPGGQPGAQAQPGQPQPAAPAAPGAEPGAAAAPGVPAARPQAPAPGAAPDALAAAAGTPTAAPAARTAAPTAPAAAPAAAKSPVPAVAKTAVKPAAAAPAPTAPSSGCSCEIAAGGVSFEGSSALVAIGLLLWARRRRL